MVAKRFVAALAVSGLASVAAAEEAVVLQPPAPRQGYFLGSSLGYAFGATRLDGTWHPPWRGPSIHLFWGQEIYTGVDVGLVAEYLSTSGKRRDLKGGGLSLALQLRPREPWLLRLEAGFGGVVLNDNKDTDASVEGSYGDVYSVTLGYELFPFYDDPYASGAFGVAPVVAVRVQPGGDTFVTGWIGVELKWWSGLPDNRLELPMDRAYRAKPAARSPATDDASGDKD